MLHPEMIDLSFIVPDIPVLLESCSRRSLYELLLIMVKGPGVEMTDREMFTVVFKLIKDTDIFI